MLFLSVRLLFWQGVLVYLAGQLKVSIMKICRHVVLFFIVLAACQREVSPVTPEQPVTPVPQLVEHTLYASTPGEDEPVTRTIVSPYDDKKILWSAHECISVLSGGKNYQFTGDNDIAASSANFTGKGPEDLGSYIALYPHDASATYSEGYVSTTLPTLQLGKAGSFADNYLVTADDATGNNISFNHMCSGLRFMVNRDDITAVTIRGNNGEKIAGDFRFRFESEDTPVAEAGTEECVTLNAPGGHFEIGTLYYIVILPTVFSKGFTIMADNGSQVGELRFDSEVTFTAGKFKNITGALNTRISSWKTPKIYYGPQNSFCLRPGGSVSIDVTPRMIEGTWQRGPVPFTADVPDAADVLWGNGSISSAALADGKLTVTASSTPGSALVAIKKNETILWSYLIWVTESVPAETTLPGGAVLQSTLGGNCYFQWGRKDPLVDGCPVISHPGDANSLSTSIRNPGHFIDRGTNCYDWYAAESYDHQDATLWGGASGSKTVWDPCPAGWRVPKEADFNVVGLTEGYAASFEKLGLLVPYGDSAVHNGDFGRYAYCWTREPSDTSSKSLLMKTDGEGFKGFSIEGDARYEGLSVRCVKE